MGSGSSKPKKPPKPCKYQEFSFALHDGPINCLALSEEGSILLTGGDDCSARIWSTNTTPVECLGVFTGHKKYITCAALIGDHALTGSADWSIRQWDLGTCECLCVFSGHEGIVNRILCSSGSGYLFSSSHDKCARAWTLKPKRGFDSCIRVFQGHTRAVIGLIFVPKEIYLGDEDVLITASLDWTAVSWSLAKGKTIRSFKGHSGPITCMHLSEDAEMLFTGSEDTTIRSWKLRTGVPITIFEGHLKPVVAIALSAKVLFSASVDRTARSWVIEFGTCTQYYRRHKHTVNSIIYYNGFVFTACGDAIARCYDAKTGIMKRQFTGHELAITGMQIANGRLFTVSVDNSLRIWILEGLVDAAGFSIMDVDRHKVPKKRPTFSEVERHPISGAPEVMLHGRKTFIMLDNPHPYDRLEYKKKKNGNGLPPRPEEELLSMT